MFDGLTRNQTFALGLVLGALIGAAILSIFLIAGGA